MLTLLVKPSARAQFDALPEIAAQAVADMLLLLQRLPRLGTQLEDHLRDVFYQKLVVVRRRRWTLHIVYRIIGDTLAVEYIDPSWLRRDL